MNLKITNNKYFRSILFKSVLIVVIFFSSCVQKKNYEEVVKDELARGIRYDSIVYGVRLGMTYDEFFSYCFDKNIEGVFKPNNSGTSVKTVIEEGYNSPVVLEFYPQSNQNNGVITIYNATLKYKEFSHYNKNYSIENLLNETIRAFEKGYKGNDFFTIPHENKLLKYNYIKIDGNRKITVKPTFGGDQLIIKFEDLNQLK